MGDSLALLSLHGCPVARLGEKDTGGMNVYVLQLAKELARRGRRVDVFTRHHDPDDPETVHLEDGARVVHLDAGPFDAGKYDLVNYIPEFLAALREFRRSDGGDYDLIHSHYWLSAQAGATLSPRMGLPALRHVPHARQDQDARPRGRTRAGAAPKNRKPARCGTPTR